MDTVPPVSNPRAVVAFLFGLLALAFLAAAAAIPQLTQRVDLLRALVVVPAAVVAALICIAMARRARFEFQRTLGRAGGNGLAAVARALGVAALLISLTAGLAVAVYAVLVLVQ
jgi:hypothetical protein